MKEFRCDHCNKKISNYHTYKIIKVEDEYDNKTGLYALYSSGYLDLCDECYKQLTKTIKNIVEDFIKFKGD